MQLDAIEHILESTPFVPLRLYKHDGKVIDIPFRHVAIPFKTGLLILIGVKSEHSRSASGKEFVALEGIERIEPKRKSGRTRCK